MPVRVCFRKKFLDKAISLGIMQNGTLLADLKQRKYDVGIAEPFSVCGLG